MMLLIILECLCIIPLTTLWYKTGKRKINPDTMRSINVAFIIGSSIINWMCFAAYQIGIIVSPTTGFFGGDLNILGLSLAILPPILIASISYFLFLIIDYINFKRFIKKEKEKK